MDAEVVLAPRNGARSPERVRVETVALAIEHIVLPGCAGFDFERSGGSAYLALHDLVLSDGDMAVDDLGSVRRLDLRQRITFLPSAVRASGWSIPTDRAHSFTALHFDQRWLLEEFEISQEGALRPCVYFQNRSLQLTLQKLGRIATSRSAPPRLLADSLALAAAADLVEMWSAESARQGRLAPSQLENVRAYVEDNLTSDITLSQLAGAAGLSVFHFSRRFKETTGTTPYRFVIEARVERAKRLMDDKTMSLAVIAERAGFSSASQFSRSFSRIVGVSPRQFR